MSDALPDLVARIRLDTSGLDAGMQQAHSSIGGFAKVAAGALAAVGIGHFVKDTIGAGMSFDATMRQMASIAGVPQEGIKELSALALQMGADTKFSADEAGQAMLELAKGGLTAAQIQGGALASTLTLAAAGGLDLESAATTTSNALNTFHLSAGQAGEVAAALAGGANASSASVESLSQALSQVGPGAVNAGLSLQETVAALSAFDNAGIKGSDAGTSLKTMLTRLVPSTDEAKDAMRKLGLDFTDATGHFIPLAQVAEQLKQKLGPLSEEQRTLALNTIFGSDATRAASVLMGEGAAGIERYTKATSDQSAAQKVADASMKGAAGAVEQLSGSWDTVKTTAGLALNSMVEGVALFGTEALNKVPAVITQIGALGSQLALGFKLDGLHGIALNLDEITGAGGRFTAVFDAVSSFVTTNLVPSLTEIGGNLQDIGANVMPVVEVAARILLGAFVELGGFLLTNLGPTIAAITGFFAAHDTTTKIVVGTVIALTAAVVTLNGIFAAATAITGVYTAAKALFTTTTNLQTGAVERGTIAELAHKAQVVASAIATGVQYVASAVAATAAVIAHTAAVVASTAAQLIVKGATIAWTAAQWLLNAALTANPIGLVVAAIALLVAGVVLAYKHSETFRGIVHDLWELLKASPLGLIIDHFGEMKDAIGWVVDKVQDLIHWLGKIKVPDLHLPDIPGLPHFAKGVRNFAGGLAVVGERGPELVNLPRGADVMTALQTRSALQGSGSSSSAPLQLTSQVIVQGSISTDVDLHAILDERDRELVTALRAGV